ncbi:restriction endonuclease subunit S [Microbacterium luticocti]|uniref:restriction endonuclease subunit S n=1 Tax=Microbacterium luticocti TaxID=451764 RepID=UPI0009FE8CD1|nr:restriction endonuclease subunit S [Microbacterium luticocti]
MSEWRTAPLGDLVQFQRGVDITRAAQVDGNVPVVSSGGVSSFHNEAISDGPGVVIGRKGTLGKAFFLPGPFWPHDTTLWIRDFGGNDPKFVYYFMSKFDVSWLDAGSANPTLNRNHLHPIAVTWPPVPEQQAIAEVLGALDDKIAANTKLASVASDLAEREYERATQAWRRVAISEVLDPILGGTPSRSVAGYWDDGVLPWVSARDVSGASSRVILDTAEKITALAGEETKARPLPVGSVILTARGTVGAVARLGIAASFNQSCYGFVPGAVPAALLYFSVLKATERAKAIAHGSVFDTITKATFDDLEMSWDADSAGEAESVLSALLGTVDQCMRENRTLAATRDALLPQLMSGKLRVRDAVAAASRVGV